MPDISVIVPVYNSEKWVRRCVDSITEQSFRSLEVICINDCSTDSSLQILRDCAHRDPRVVIVDLPENRGVGGARNAGLAIAKGKYIGFVDSDDTVDNNFFAELFDTIEKVKVDMVEAPINFVNDAGKSIRIPGWTWFCSSLFNLHFLTEHNISFPARFPQGEDQIFMARVLLSRPTRKKIFSTRYNYFQIPTSASHSRSDDQSVELLAAYQFIFREIVEFSYGKKDLGQVAGQVFNVFFQHLLARAPYVLTERGMRFAAKMLADIFLKYPYLGVAKQQLGQTDQRILSILLRGDSEALTDEFIQKKHNMAKKLRIHILERTSLD